MAQTYGGSSVQRSRCEGDAGARAVLPPKHCRGPLGDRDVPRGAPVGGYRRTGCDGKAADSDNRLPHLG